MIFKLILAPVFFVLAMSQLAFADCEIPAEHHVKTVEYKLRLISGNWKIKYKVPDLAQAELRCPFGSNGPVWITFKEGSGIKFTSSHEKMGLLGLRQSDEVLRAEYYSWMQGKSTLKFVMPKNNRRVVDRPVTRIVFTENKSEVQKMEVTYAHSETQILDGAVTYH